MTLAGLAERQNLTAAEVDLGSVLWHLAQGPATVYALADELGLRAEETPRTGAVAEWAFLTRRWPSAPARDNGGGMPRGIARGSTEPAVEVTTPWAATAVRDALVDERPSGLLPRTRVRVIGGDARGQVGEVVGPAWLLDDEHRNVVPGPPPGYEVTLTGPAEAGEARHGVAAVISGGISKEAPGLPAERTIVRADDLGPQDA
ncbi:hypothetical protein [Streptomyces sp. NPDC006510]|uniref:hypothetical protein n=1 Tax=Streptomyces sp. NPDC006510 TaxID=3155600 RepID=UPI0033BC3328